MSVRAQHRTRSISHITFNLTSQKISAISRKEFSVSLAFHSILYTVIEMIMSHLLAISSLENSISCMGHFVEHFKGVQYLEAHKLREVN